MRILLKSLALSIFAISAGSASAVEVIVKSPELKPNYEKARYAPEQVERTVQIMATLKFDDVALHEKRMQKEAELRKEYEDIRAKVYKFEKENLIYTYSPTTLSQVLLPADIYDRRVKRVSKKGYITAAEFAQNKDKVSIYFSQNKKAQHLFGLYNQRILAWHDGIPLLHTTIQKAVDEEALFPFWEINLTSNAVTASMFEYLDKRLSSLDLDVVKKWVEKNNNNNHVETLKLVDILATSATNSRMSTFKTFEFYEGKKSQ